MKIVGILLVVVGLLGLAYGGLSFTRKSTVVDAGPLQITKDKTETLPIPPIAGGILLIVGVIVIVKSGSTT